MDHIKNTFVNLRHQLPRVCLPPCGLQERNSQAWIRIVFQKMKVQRQGMAIG